MAKKKSNSEKGRMSKNKGARGEREFSAYLRERGFSAKRSRQYCGDPDAPDIKSSLDSIIHWEIKRVESLNINKAMIKAVEDAGPQKIPIIAHRKNNQPWLVTMHAEHIIEMLRILYPELCNQKQNTPEYDESGTH